MASASDLTQASWQAFNRLLDEALDLPPGDRLAWVERLGAEHDALKPALRKVLGQQKGAGAQWLETLPHTTSAAAADEMGLAPEARVGPYRLLRELGVGGMGAVWLAERADGSLKRHVALKLPRATWSRGLAERMARERDILASLEHPNIARLYDAGTDEQGRPYLALEYVEGRPIDVYCRERALRVRARLALLLQVAQAVAFAHSRLVIHRDLKPSNILVTADGHVRLLDFGIAKLMEGHRAEETQLTMLAGRALTLDYASPEQIHGEPIGTASDVYSLGVVAYELLAGVRPYKLERGSAAELEEAITASDIRPASAVAEDTVAKRELKGDLDAILNKALKKLQGERYATVDAMAQDVERYLAGHRVVARPDSLSYRASRLVRRYRMPLTAATVSVAAFGLAFGAGAMALVILALLLGIGAVAWQARKALTQAEIAREQTRIAQVEAKTAEAVQAFLEGIFRANTGDQADPRKARQRTAKDLLDEGARRIEHDLNSAPQAKLRVLRVLGLMYEDMIELETSIAMDDRRIETARRAYGPGSSEELHARADRASRLIHVERANEAEAELERARLLLEARADHSIEAQTAYYMHRARYCQYRQDVEGGLGSIDKALGLLRSQPPSVYLVGALEIRAALLNFVQRSEDALAAADEGLALIAAQPGLAESLRSELHLRAAQAHAHLNDYTAAESAFRAAAAAVDAVGGPTSEMAAYVRAWQGRVLLQGSRVRAAGEAARESASIILAGIEQRPYFLAILSEAIAAYRRLGWLADALPLIEYCEAMAPEQAENRLAATNFLVNRAALAIESGDFGDAQASLARARAVIETRGLGTHPVYRDAYVATLVRLHAEQGDGDGALHELRDAYAASGGEPAADDPAAAQTAAIATLAVGDAAATAQLCERALAIIEQDPKRDARAELEAALHLLNGRAHLAGGDARGALEPLRRAEAMHRDLYDPEPAPWLARAKIILGEALRATGDIDGAVTMLQEAKLMHARHDRLGPQYTGPLQSLASALNVGAK